MRRHDVWNVLLFFIAALSLLSLRPAGAQQQQPESDEVALLRSSGNEYEKKDALHSLVTKHVEKKITIPDETLEAFLAGGMGDESPIVAEEAIRGIGLASMKKFEKSLVSLYADAESRFGGYAERIRLSIIGTLGKVGDKKTAALFNEILAADNGTDIGSQTLSAIKTLNDPALIPDVVRYAEKMDELAARGAAAGHDPMLYSTRLQNAREARETIVALGGKKGE